MALPEHEGNQALDQVAEEGCGVSSLVAIQNLTGPEQPALTGPIGAGDGADGLLRSLSTNMIL